MDDGYILLHRKMVDWEWYSDLNTKVLFLHCLLKANWKEGKFQGREIKRGQFVTSLPQLAEETQLSIQQIRTALKHLKSTGELTDESTTKYRIVTVSKYDKYQCINRQDNSQATDNQQTTNRQLTAIEERNKEINNISNTSSKDSVLDCQTETVRPTERHADDVKKIVEAWNSLERFGIAPVSKVSPGSKRYINLVGRIREYGMDDMLTAISKIPNSKFLQGHNNRGWVVTFDWFLKPSNFPKVLDGNYNSTKGGQTDWSWLENDSQ